jgi:thiamine pyrophosphokinase
MPRLAPLRRAIVLAGGDPVEPDLSEQLAVPDDVIAADSGLHQAELLGLVVTHIVGDFDSVKASAVDAAVAKGATVDRHPVAKDATDLELALLAARDRGADRITVVGGGGGRLDHALANVALLAASTFDDVHIDAWLSDAHITVTHGGRPPVVLDGVLGSIVTLIPVGGPAIAVTTAGLEYPLHAEDLPAGTSRGVSNVVAAAQPTVSLERGALLVVQTLGGAQ